VAKLLALRRRVWGLAAVTLVGGIVTTLGLRSHGAAQEIPAAVPFDHTVHAREYGMTCLGCHVYAAQSTVAGLPSVRRCMGCHKFVAKDKPGVQALAALYEKGEAPRWPRVTALPDFIYFSHRMHVRNGVACSECHGEVKDMKTVRMAVDMNMGFCLSCHSQRHATVDCVACHK
jgi:hypothetical protein